MRSFLQIQNDLIMAQDQWDTFQDEEFLKQVDQYTQELMAKTDGVTKLYRRMDLEIEMLSEQKKRVEKAIKTIKNGQERMKFMVLNAYETTGNLPPHSALFPLNVGESRGKVDVVDEGLVPEEYLIAKVTYSVNKEKAKSDMENGKEIPGLSLVKSKFLKGIALTKTNRNVEEIQPVDIL